MPKENPDDVLEGVIEGSGANTPWWIAHHGWHFSSGDAALVQESIESAKMPSKQNPKAPTAPPVT